MKKSKARQPSPDSAPSAFTVWGPDGVEVVGLQNGRPAGRCRFGGNGPASFDGEEAVSRAMLEAAIEAVRNGALGDMPEDRRVRLP